jgi:NitT/TauT family transport system ATP-binding protein
MKGVHVAVSDLTRTFESVHGQNPVHALGPVSFHINPGEFLSVVGPSGCGKSTLMECIAGLTTPTSGRIVVGDVTVSGEVPSGVGVVFQENAAFPWLTVDENISFGLKHSNVTLPANEIRNRVDEAIELIGLQAFKSHYPSQLSGGMRQRVAIARTLVTKPDFILMDEPFGALDPQTRLLMGDELLKIWRASGATVFLITHSLEEAVLLSDRVLAMTARPGKIKTEIKTPWSKDRTTDISSSPQFGQLVSELWGVMREESKLAMAQSERIA